MNTDINPYMNPDWGTFWLATACFFVLGVFVLWLVWYAWNYKSKSQLKEEKILANEARLGRWEKSHYNTVLLPKARWEIPPDDEWKN